MHAMISKYVVLLGFACSLGFTGCAAGNENLKSASQLSFRSKFHATFHQMDGSLVITVVNDGDHVAYRRSDAYVVIEGKAGSLATLWTSGAVMANKKPGGFYPLFPNRSAAPEQMVGGSFVKFTVSSNRAHDASQVQRITLLSATLKATRSQVEPELVNIVALPAESWAE